MSEVKATQELVNVKEHMTEAEMAVFANMEEELNQLIIGCMGMSADEQEKNVKLGVIMSFAQHLLSKAMQSSITRAGMLVDEEKMLLVTHDVVNGIRDELLADLQKAVMSWCSYRRQLEAAGEAKKAAGA